MSPSDTPAEGTIRCEQRGALLLVGIDRPAKYNGFTPRMFLELAQAYTRLDDDDALRVGVLHGFGAHFTAGLDLPMIAPFMQRGEKLIPAGLVEPMDLGSPGLRRRAKPMVVAVKGITYTLGIERSWKSSAGSWPLAARPCAWPSGPAPAMRCCTCSPATSSAAPKRCG